MIITRKEANEYEKSLVLAVLGGSIESLYKTIPHRDNNVKTTKDKEA